MKPEKFDVVIIGAGFYGTAIANYLVSKPEISSIAIIESEEEPLRRASSNNQARIHNGYHYPRSLATADASRRSYAKFKSTWPSAVFSNFRHFYAISKHASLVSTKQFEATMSAIKAPLRKLSNQEMAGIFDGSRVEQGYEVLEEAFNFLELRKWANEIFLSNKIKTFFGETVISVEKDADRTAVRSDTGLTLSSKLLFNVSYGGLGQIQGLEEEVNVQIRHELTEMNLVETSGPFNEIALTVMDGPFFSLMPYPSQAGTATFSHVRYTPRFQISGISGINPYPLLNGLSQENNSFELMRRDASRFVPELANVRPVGHIREVKTILNRSATNDSRPVLFIRHKNIKAFSVLGAKIDNVFDIITELEKVDLN
jgi:glycine/D-amino acid oxidase-like deaminating enzyme